MNGVEILSSETIYNTFLPVVWIGLGLMLGFISIILFVWSISEGYEILPWIFVVFVIVCIIIASLAGTPNTNDPNHIEYKVTIDDSVSMNEFLDKYEILDQEGKIYTVKERE